MLTGQEFHDKIKNGISFSKYNRNRGRDGYTVFKGGVHLNTKVICEMTWRTFPTLTILYLVCHIPAFTHEILKLSRLTAHYGDGDTWSLIQALFKFLKNSFYALKLLVLLVTSKVFCDRTKDMIHKSVQKLKQVCTIPTNSRTDDDRHI